MPAIYVNAALILFVWLVVATGVVLTVNHRVRKLEQVHATTAGMFGPVVPLAYALTFNFWPLALVVGILQLRSPELARQGRLTIYFVLMLATLQLTMGVAWHIFTSGEYRAP